MLARNLLILVVTGIREGLDLDGGPINGFTRLHFNDGSLNALLQVYKASTVPLSVHGRDEGILDPEWIPGTVCPHGVLDVHADGVVNLRGQAGV